ncbi:MAG: GNAT family N-acetyltransferase [candidate division WOR-3 bacterium]|nr:MAG: GNAT family N-acetyltransferase [candidate division WOR-3 bacterium]
MRLIDVDAGNVEQTGFFCYMSRRRSEGFKRKLGWLKARFEEGMRLKMLGRGERGFVEYLPGEYAWRPVDAEGYLFIHCLWVVGKSKGKGYGTKLLDASVRDARKDRMKGVAILASEGNWLAGPKLLERNGFEVVDQAPPRFLLMARRFGRSKPPRFTGEWEQKAKRFGKGLTVVRTDQCPYIDDATTFARDAASEYGLGFKEIELESAGDVRESCPSAYGTFSIVLDSRLFSYHYLTRRDFEQRLAEARQG